MNRRDRLRLEERRRESMASHQDHDQDQDNSKTLMDSFFQSQQVIQSLSSKPASGENDGSKTAVISKSFRIPRKQNQPEKNDDQLDRSRSIYEPEEQLNPNNNQNGRWTRTKPSARAGRKGPPSHRGSSPHGESCSQNEKPASRNDFSALKGHPPQEEHFPTEPSSQRAPPTRRDFSPSRRSPAQKEPSPQITVSPRRETPSRGGPDHRGERSHRMEPHPGNEFDRYISEKELLPEENLTRRQRRSRDRYQSHIAKLQARKDELKRLHKPSTGQEDVGDENNIKKIKLDEDDDDEEDEGGFPEESQTTDAERAAAINNTPIQMVIYDRSDPDGKIDPNNAKSLHDWFIQIIKEELLSGSGIIPQYLGDSYKDGEFIIMSTNSPSADFLKGKIENMSALWEGAKLECVYKTYKERIAVVTLPLSITHPTSFFAMCKESNPELATENWRLIAFEGKNSEGNTFTLAIDVNSFKFIIAKRGFIHCRDRKVEFILERK